MMVSQIHYEELLSTCSHYQGALTLLKSYRPYLETLPSMRRPNESLITIPLPNISIRETDPTAKGPITVSRKVTPLPCDVALLMCDPEWKIKTGVEIFIFIHRPDEDFSELLTRWRQTQVLLNGGYEWVMPQKHEHLLNEGVDKPYPLFVAFPQTPERIIRGIKGAGLPVIIHTPTLASELDAQAKAAKAAATPNAETDSPYLDEMTDWELNLDTLDEFSEGHE